MKQRIVNALNLILIAEASDAPKAIKEALGDQVYVAHLDDGIAEWDRKPYTDFVASIPADAEFVVATQFCFLVGFWYFAPQLEEYIRKLDTIVDVNKERSQAEYMLSVCKSLESLDVTDRQLSKLKLNRKSIESKFEKILS